MDQVDVNTPLENPKLKALFTQKKAAKSEEEFDSVMNELCGEIVMNAHFLSVVKFSKEPEPKEYPSAMTDAICTYAKTDRQIRSIWLKLMQKDGEFSYLLVVDSKGGEPKSIFSKIGDAAKPFLNGKYLDMVAYSEDFGASAVDGSEPFYKKKTGFFSK